MKASHKTVEWWRNFHYFDLHRTVCEVCKCVPCETHEKPYTTAKNGGGLNSFWKLIARTSMKFSLHSPKLSRLSFFFSSRSQIFNGMHDISRIIYLEQIYVLMLVIEIKCSSLLCMVGSVLHPDEMQSINLSVKFRNITKYNDLFRNIRLESFPVCKHNISRDTYR